MTNYYDKYFYYIFVKETFTDKIFSDVTLMINEDQKYFAEEDPTGITLSSHEMSYHDISQTNYVVFIYLLDGIQGGM